MEWIPLQLSHKPLFDAHLKNYPIDLSDYTFTNFWMWNSARNYHIALFEEWLCTRFTFEGNELFMMPIGPKITDGLLQALLQSTSPFIMRAVSEERAKEMVSLLPKPITLTAEENRFDYLYGFNQLKTLAGNDLQPKRNLIHQFEEEYGDSFQLISADNLPLVIEMQRTWISAHKPDAHLLEEHCALIRALEYYEPLGLEGGCLIVDNKVVAYTLAEMLTKDTLVIHAEKALNGYKGAYQTINQQFLAHHKETLYVNREESLGIPALDQAKRSYHPINLLKKFKIERSL